MDGVEGAQDTPIGQELESVSLDELEWIVLLGFDVYPTTSNPARL